MEGKGGGVNFENIFIALFHVSGYVDQFKAIKQKPLREVGTSDPSSETPPQSWDNVPTLATFFFEGFPHIVYCFGPKCSK